MKKLIFLKEVDNFFEKLWEKVIRVDSLGRSVIAVVRNKNAILSKLHFRQKVPIRRNSELQRVGVGRFPGAFVRRDVEGGDDAVGHPRSALHGSHPQVQAAVQ